MINKLFRSTPALFKNTLTPNTQYCIGHIKNMLDENLKHEIAELDAQPIWKETDRVYKPSYTLEFNR